MMRRALQVFWSWYEKNYRLNVTIASFLFVWQLVHLYWLGAHVILLRLLGTSYLSLSEFWQPLIIFVDYIEIPALISVSLIYIYALRKGFSWKSVWMLIFLNSQWLHLFWITDEFVIGQFSGAGMSVFPVWLAWIAILIDYLELPVMYDTFKRVFFAMKSNFEKNS